MWFSDFLTFSILDARLALTLWTLLVALAVVVIVRPHWILSCDPLAALIVWRVNKEFIRRRPKRIILIRHGESQANTDRSIYTKVPSHRIELTDQGHEQAKKSGQELRKLLKNETVLFYVSPFIRSMQTFEHLCEPFEARSYEVRTDPRLREQDFGNLQEAHMMDTIALQRNSYSRFYFRFPHGESGADVFDRISSFLESMFRQFKSDRHFDNIVMVSHGLQIRLFLMRYFRWSIEKFEQLRNLKNCQIVVLSKKADGTFSLNEPLEGM